MIMIRLDDLEFNAIGQMLQGLPFRQMKPPETEALQALVYSGAIKIEDITKITEDQPENTSED